MIATVFWDAQGVIMLDFLAKKSTITGEFYANLLETHEEVMAAVEDRVRDKDPSFFSSGLMALEHRWSKCIILEGNYIEKEEIDLTQK